MNTSEMSKELWSTANIIAGFAIAQNLAFAFALGKDLAGLQSQVQIVLSLFCLVSETSEDNNGSVGANACTAMLTQMNFNLGARKGNATTYRARIWAESVNFGSARTRSPILEILSP
jgi:hypothetical protein